jgi:hypothetical protein
LDNFEVLLLKTKVNFKDWGCEWREVLADVSPSYVEVGVCSWEKQSVNICEVGGCSREHHVFEGKYKLLPLKPLI